MRSQPLASSRIRAVRCWSGASAPCASPRPSAGLPLTLSTTSPAERPANSAGRAPMHDTSSRRVREGSAASALPSPVPAALVCSSRRCCRGLRARLPSTAAAAAQSPTPSNATLRSAGRCRPSHAAREPARAAVSSAGSARRPRLSCPHSAALSARSCRAHSVRQQLTSATLRTGSTWGGWCGRGASVAATVCAPAGASRNPVARTHTPAPALPFRHGEEAADVHEQVQGQVGQGDVRPPDAAAAVRRLGAGGQQGAEPARQPARAAPLRSIHGLELSGGARCRHGTSAPPHRALPAAGTPHPRKCLAWARLRVNRHCASYARSATQRLQTAQGTRLPGSAAVRVHSRRATRGSAREPGGDHEARRRRQGRGAAGGVGGRTLPPSELVGCSGDKSRALRGQWLGLSWPHVGPCDVLGRTGCRAVLR